MKSHYILPFIENRKDYNVKTNVSQEEEISIRAKVSDNINISKLP